MNWSVESTLLGSHKKYYAEIDVDMLRRNRTEEIEVQEDVCHPKEHGTIIKVWNLNHKLAGRQIGKTKDKLRGIYRIDLRSNNIKIYYNGEALTFEEPNRLIETLPDGSLKKWEQPVDFCVENDGKQYRVTGFIALRETASTSNAGFALIRYGRVIIGGYENNYRPEEIFEKPNSFVYQRLFGELNMDDWPVTNTKDAFDWYNGLEDALIDKLNEVCEEYKKKAREYRKTPALEIETNLNKVATQFARAGIIKDVSISTITPAKQAQLAAPPSLESDAEKQTSVDNPPFPETEVIPPRDDSRKIEFTTNGVVYTINLLIQKSDPDKNWLYITKADNEYVIEWNIRHPFFKQFLKDKESTDAMSLFIFAFAIAEIDALATNADGKISPSDIRIKMNEMLKKVMKEGS